MSVWEALLLGVVQGFTEFLPISSSGHLVIFQQLLGWHEAVLTFDILLHLATLLAIVVFFGRSLFKVTFKEWLLVGLGTVPAVIIGVLFKDQIEAMFASDRFVGWELIITGLINLGADRYLNRPNRGVSGDLASISWVQALLMGIGQAIAIIPGISRSGTTVATGIVTKVEREAAFRFSFLLALPALLGAGMLQLKDTTAADWAQLSLPAVGVGCAAALITGLASLVIFQWVIKRARLEWFGWYCIVVGAAAAW